MPRLRSLSWCLDELTEPDTVIVELWPQHTIPTLPSPGDMALHARHILGQIRPPARAREGAAADESYGAFSVAFPVTSLMLVVWPGQDLRTSGFGGSEGHPAGQYPGVLPYGSGHQAPWCPIHCMTMTVHFLLGP